MAFMNLTHLIFLIFVLFASLKNENVFAEAKKQHGNIFVNQIRSSLEKSQSIELKVAEQSNA